jgi:L-asparagine transporter-like permease
VVTIVAFIVLGGLFLAGGRVAPQYTASGGFFPNGGLAPLLATAFAIFTFGGVEMVAIASGEAKSGKDVARATWVMYGVLTFIYVGAVAVLVGVLAWREAGVAESPFVSVFRLAGLGGAATVMNVVVLTAALSGANASLYSAARMVFSLARTGYAPSGLGKLTRHGSPLRALMASSLGIVAAAWVAVRYPESAFLYMFGGALGGGVAAWLVGLAAHVQFRRRMSAEQIKALPLRLPGGAASSVVAFIVMSLAVLATWPTQLRVTLLGGPPILGALTVAYFVTRGRRKT